jgi:hypothetical protein
MTYPMTKMVIGTKGTAKKKKGSTSKYQFYVYTWTTTKHVTGIPPVKKGRFEFICGTDDVGKAHLIGSLLDGANHKCVISRPNETDEERLGQLNFRYKQQARYELEE